MALHADIRALASRYFPETRAASSPPLDTTMDRLQRQIDTLNTCCDEPRVRGTPLGRTTPCLSGSWPSVVPPHTPLLQRDLVDEAEVRNDDELNLEGFAAANGGTDFGKSRN